jgi:hypothetical protein
MTLRKLYNYVMKSISTRPNNLPENCIMPHSVRNMNDIRSPSSMDNARKKKLSEHGGGYIPTIRNEEIPLSSGESSHTGHESAASIWESISSSESADEQKQNNDPLHKRGASKSLMKGTISNEVDQLPLRHASPSINCTETDVVAINPLYLSSAATHMAPEVSNTRKVSFRVPDLQETRDPQRDPNGPAAPTATTYRQRLGGYLHPRDMRRLVTPFSSTNEPQLIVRRHVMLLNFDPLRAVVLRDRLLVLIPDGADDLIMALERRVRGGVAEMENRIFGDDELADLEELIISGEPSQGGSSRQASRFSSVEHRFVQQPSTGMSTGSSHSKQNDDDQDTDASDTGDSNDMDINDTDEWAEMGTMNWIDMPFELQAVDAVLSTVMSMLADDGDTLRNKVQVAMAKFRGDTAHNSNPSELAQDKLRILKDHVKHMEARVQGFVRAMNLVLNDDADMALMNLSRLVTHPERFIQPVPDEILAEESDEPELILEAYLQHALSTVNAMDFVKSAITNTEELVALQLDSLRNKLLYINTLVSLLTLSISCASLVGSFMGMNVPNHLEDDPNAFRQIIFGTMFGALGLALLFLILFQMTGALPSGSKSLISFYKK